MKLRWIAAATLSAVLLWVGFFAVILSGDNYRRMLPDELVWPNASSWRMLSGEGGMSPQGWEITGAGRFADARLGVSLQTPVLAEQVEGIEIEFEHSIEFRSIAMGWTGSASAYPRRLASVSLKDRMTATVDTDQLDQRAAQINYLVIEVLGGFDQPLTIRAIRLLPARPGLIELQRRVLGEWFEFPPWTQKSLNLTEVSTRSAVIAFPLAITAWLVLSVVLWIAISSGRSRRTLWVGMLVYAIVAWGLLDLRWQIDLMLKSREAVETFAGKSPEERRLSDLDGELFTYIEQLKAQLGPEARRVFTFGAGEYWRLRARYHALPWSVRDVAQSMRGSWVRHLHPGDVFLLLDAQHVQVSQIAQAPSDFSRAARAFNLAEVLADDAALSGSHEAEAIITAGEGEKLISTRVRDLSAPGAYTLNVQMRATPPGAQTRIRIAARGAEGERAGVTERLFEPGSDEFTALRLPFYIDEGGSVDIHVAGHSGGAVELRAMQIEPPTESPATAAWSMRLMPAVSRSTCGPSLVPLSVFHGRFHESLRSDSCDSSAGKSVPPALLHSDLEGRLTSLRRVCTVSTSPVASPVTSPLGVWMCDSSVAG